MKKKNKRKNVIMQYAIDEDIVNQIADKDDFSIFEENGQKTYVCKNPITKSNSKVQETGVVYNNAFLAFDPEGKLNEGPIFFKSADLEIHLDTKTIYRDGKEIELFNKSYRIIEAFMRSPDRKVSRDVLTHVLEDDKGKRIQDNTINQHVNRTRRKLGKYKGIQYFSSLYCYGYVWNFEIQKIK